MYLSGYQLAKGYLNRDKENKESFFNNPFDGDKSGYEKMYKTGDISYLEVILSSTSITDFISGYYMISKMATYDTEMLEQIEKEKQDSETKNARKSQVGSGDRSEKIRTYNYPQGRITDHRIGFSCFQMENFLNGDLDEMINNLIAADRAERLKGEED